jgi:hypothetical protein
LYWNHVVHHLPVVRDHGNDVHEYQGMYGGDGYWGLFRYGLPMQLQRLDHHVCGATRLHMESWRSVLGDCVHLRNAFY